MKTRIVHGCFWLALASLALTLVAGPVAAASPAEMSPRPPPLARMYWAALPMPSGSSVISGVHSRTSGRARRRLGVVSLPSFMRPTCRRYLEGRLPDDWLFQYVSRAATAASSSLSSGGAGRWPRGRLASLASNRSRHFASNEGRSLSGGGERSGMPFSAAARRGTAARRTRGRSPGRCSGYGNTRDRPAHTTPSFRPRIRAASVLGGPRAVRAMQWA